MISTIASVFVLITSIHLISSINAAVLPGNFTLPKNSDQVSFAARFDLTLNVEYLKTDGKTAISRIPLNNQTFQYYDGTYALTNSHTLSITMFDNLTSIELAFTLNEKNQTLLQKVQAIININNNTAGYFPNYARNVEGMHIFIANESLFSTDRSNSYRCNTKTSIDNFQTNRNVTLKSIDLENVRVQPFADNSIIFHDYAVEKVCPMDIFKSSNLIPIIVGVCLGVLVIVVLVAYLICRRRNRNGYQSV